MLHRWSHDSPHSTPVMSVSLQCLEICNHLLRGCPFHTFTSSIKSCGMETSTVSTVFEDQCAFKILATAHPPHFTLRSESLTVCCHWFSSHLGTRDDKGSDCGCPVLLEKVNEARSRTVSNANLKFEKFMIKSSERQLVWYQLVFDTMCLLSWKKIGISKTST